MKIKSINRYSLLIVAILAICSSFTFTSCSVFGGDYREQRNISSIADKVWTYGQSHQDGFTLDIRTLTEPTNGIAVSYAETQNSHSREQLNFVVKHALNHSGYVGGWFNNEDSLYYFDSTKLYPEESLNDAIRFGISNDQQSLYILSSGTYVAVGETIEKIVERGTIIIGTTGDYRPLTFLESETGEYWGFGIDVANEIADRIGVEVEFVQTSWPTLTADVLAEPQKFDFAIGGITITDARCETMLMSDGYLANGKTILCRASEADRYKSLDDIDKPEVRVMVNPGGLNEKFANENLKQATIIVHQRNEEIPSLIAEGAADIMITEITEAPYYVETDERLAAPLLNEPFTRGQIGVLMRKGQDDLLQLVNIILSQMKSDNTLRQLHNEYGLVYGDIE